MRGFSSVVRHRARPTALLVVLVFFLSFVAAPIILLLSGRTAELQIGSLAGLGLLSIGVAALIGALLSRFYDRGRCTCFERILLTAANWLLNPVWMAVLGAQFNFSYLVEWSGTPLALVVLFTTWKLPLAPGDPTWIQMPRGFRCCLTWLCSRLVCVALPACLLSMQLALYVPVLGPGPTGAQLERELAVVGGCVLISSKFFFICGQIATRPSQALVCLILLSADWTSILNLLGLFKDEMEFEVLLLHLWLAGVLEFRDALKELRVCSGRRSGADGATSESDSDSERHETVLASFNFGVLKVLGFSAEETAQRQFLCAARRALIVSTPPPPLVSEPTRLVAPQPAATRAAAPGSASSSSGSFASASADAAHQMEMGEAPTQDPSLEIAQEETCSICLSKFQSGDQVRPLPKCCHVFHAECLESWARQKREGTPCPVCRRPALIRKAVDGAVNISSLGAPPPSVSTRATGRGGGRGGRQGRRSAQPRNPQARQSRGGGGAAPSSETSAQDLQASLGVSLAMAEVALEVTDGDANVAANLIMEHATMVLAFASSRLRRRHANRAPRGMAEALAGVENPFLAGQEAALQVQLSYLVQQERLESTAWDALSTSQQRDALRAIMTHVSEHQLERAA
mmetsp:Transcript_4353/g.7446  ORF Transcript_4353/g.7446 Transcript_4353/m.7446 type:complete len:631 (-) Transcript_4353:122-2014(-)